MQEGQEVFPQFLLDRDPPASASECGEDRSKLYLGGSLNTLFIAGLDAGQTLREEVRVWAHPQRADCGRLFPEPVLYMTKAKDGRFWQARNPLLSSSLWLESSVCSRRCSLWRN